MAATEEAAEVYDELDAAEQGLTAAAEGGSDDELTLERSTRKSSRRRGNKAEKRKEAVRRIKNNERNWAEAEDDALYDVVDEAQYNELRNSRLNEDDFIEDDEGDDFGYRDHGGEIFDEEDFQGDSAAAAKARRSGGGGGGPRKKKMPRRRVNKLFTGSGKASRLGAAVVKFGDEATVGDEDDFLAEVLAETGDAEDLAIEEGEETTISNKDAMKARKRKKKGGLQQLALFGSTNDTRSAYLAGPVESSPGTIGSSAAGSPGMTKQQRLQFTGSGKRKVSAVPGIKEESSAMDYEQQMENAPEQPADEEATPADEAPAKKKKTRTLVAMTEEELDEIENAPEGSKDHLKVSKGEVKTNEWEKVRRSTTALADEVKLTTTDLPCVDMEGEGNEGKKTMRFFWVDAMQGENHMSDNIYLFGKVFSPEAKAHVSCCVTVQNVERQIFVLPRAFKVDKDGDTTDEPVGMMDVYAEMAEIMKHHGITSQQCKPVERKYAFEQHDVPREATWLKFKYSAKFAKLPMGLKGKTFSHVFGTNIDPLERFIMKRDLMGPCWVDIKDVNGSGRNISWCKLEAQTVSYKNVVKPQQQPESPTFVVLSLRMQTVLNKKSHQNEIICLSGLVHNNIECDGPTTVGPKDYAHFTAIRKLGDNPWPFDFSQRVHQTMNGTMQICSSERALLGFVMAKVARIDPDVIVGHNLLGFDLDVLLHRIKANTIPHWSRIGRLKRTIMPKLSAGSGGKANYTERTLAVGRMLVDVKVSAREFVRQTTYEMDELVKVQLHKERQDVDPDQIPQMYQNSDTLMKLVDHVSQDSLFIFELMFKLMVIPLTKQITNITGGLLAKTFAGGRSQRNEYLLCHEFHKRKFIVPDKLVWQDKSKPEDGEDGAKKSNPRRKKAAYAGGLVLEPKRGFYDKFILLLDFNSLYPSIIQEYDLCFTTVKRDHLATNPDSDDPVMADVPDTTNAGILPKVIRGLILKRRAVKDLIKSEKKSARPDAAKLVDYDIRQLALKLTANSMYGCLGFTASRFYAKPIAALITMKGREILQKTVDLAQDQLNLDVIYGDTDSIMINTRTQDLGETKKIGNMVKKEVNALYKELEIEIDGVFKTMLLLKKKKYAAITITEHNGEVILARETKGLDMVRRDWSELSHNVGYYILNQILERDSRESLVEACHEYLREIAETLKLGKIPLEKFIIHKGLTKDPKQYADGKHQPHVLVALRMNAAKPGSAKALDTIPYVVCRDGTTNPASNRAYHIDEMKKNTELTVDNDYYLKNQLHPVVARLLDPIDGTDSGQIADCLGLDSQQFLRSVNDFDHSHSEIGMGMMSQMSDEERFKTAEKLKIRCQKCNMDLEFQGVFKTGSVAAGNPQVGLLCSNPTCDHKHTVAYLCNKMTLAIRGFINKYYAGEIVCDDQACPLSTSGTRQISAQEGARCFDDFCRGSCCPAYSDAMLYNQICYFQTLVDTAHALKTLEGDTKTVGETALTSYYKEFEQIFAHVDKTLARSARKHVDLGVLFTSLGLKESSFL